MAFEPSRLDFTLPDYYKKIFPFKPYVKWLSYNRKLTEYFNRREFAFILDGDVHLRYRSFNDAAEFEKELCKTNPHKLDVGAVYNHCPKESKKHPDFKAEERELVFDIDLTDYDNVRTCCSEAKVCSKCWKFVAYAVKVLDFILDEHFGFESRMWVFSGRRGVHCWIADEKARKLNNNGRSAIAEYMSFIAGEKLKLKQSVYKGVKPHAVYEDAYRIALDSGIFESMLFEQGWLDGQDGIDKVAKVEDSSISKYLVERFEKLTPQNRWKLLLYQFDEKRRMEKQTEWKLPEAASGACANFLKCFVLWHAYPRLDINVSTGVNHLLKSPFCIHPKTGNIAVPLDVANIENFDVDECPRIDKVLDELKKFSNEEEVKENRKILGYKHTSLAPHVEIFERFVNSISN